MSGDVTAPATTTAAAVRVRRGRREDMPLIAALIKELAAFVGDPDEPRLTEADLIRDGFDSGEEGWFFTLVAETMGEGSEGGEGGEVAGYALCSRAYSSWWGRALYLEDLYVRPQHRRAGVATKLLQALAQIGVSERASHITWQVVKSNARALAFYTRLGARELREHERRYTMRLYQSEIKTLAQLNT